MRIPIARIPRHKRPIPVPLPATSTERPGPHLGRRTPPPERTNPAFHRRPWVDGYIWNLHIHAHDRSHNPLWILVNRLSGHKRRVLLHDALRKQGISVDEFRTWEDIVRAPNATLALDRLAGRQATGVAPVWLILHISSHLVKTPFQAQRVMGVVMSYLKSVDPSISPWMLAIVAHSLARHNMLAQLTQVIDVLLEPSLCSKTSHINHVLLAVTRLQPSPESAEVALHLLRIMAARQHRLSNLMFRLMTKNRRFILALNKSLRSQLIPSGMHLTDIPFEHVARCIVGDAVQSSGAHRLEGGSLGKTTAAEERMQARPMDASEVVPVSEFGHLGQLLHTVIRPEWQSVRARKFGLLRSRLYGPLRRGVMIRQRPAKVRKMRLAYAARDVREVPSHDLVKHLAKVPQKSLKPSAIATTMRGLYVRRDYDAVLELWARLVTSNMRVSGDALDVIVRTLASTGKCNEAFELLEQYRGHNNATPIGRGSSSVVSIETVNALCSGFISSNRPDVVLRLWDVLDLLYEVHPNNYTMKLMLGAACRVGPLANSTVRGAMAQLGVSFSFRKTSAMQPPSSRNEAAAGIKAILSQRGVQSGLWHNVEAAETAGRVFRQVVLGNRPDLLDAQPPAYALRQNADDAMFHPMSEIRTAILGSSFTSASTAPATHNIQALVAQGLYPPPFPNLRADDKAFKLYITLLGSSGRASEIALALTWMRMLNGRPSRKTLALALIYWGEVSMAAPWLEARAQRAARSQYARLTQWIRDWVGDDKMPRDVDMRNTLQWMRKTEDRRAARNTHGRRRREDVNFED
jgi:hypothetical protein